MTEYEYVGPMEPKEVIGARIVDAYYDGTDLFIELDNGLVIVVEDTDGWGDFAVLLGRVKDEKS